MHRKRSLVFWLTACLALGIACCGGVRPARAASDRLHPSANPENLNREELFLKIFKHAPPLIPVETYLQLVINGKERGKVSAVFNDARTEFTIPAQPVLDAISGMLTARALASVHSGVDAGGRISPRASLPRA